MGRSLNHLFDRPIFIRALPQIWRGARVGGMFGNQVGEGAMPWGLNIEVLLGGVCAAL